MGLFSSTKHSYVRKWARKQRDSYKVSLSLDDVLAGMILCTSSLGKHLKHYLGDASLFEVVCFFR